MPELTVSPAGSPARPRQDCPLGQRDRLWQGPHRHAQRCAHLCRSTGAGPLL